MKKISIIFGVLFLVIAIAGIYKFNYLSGQPGHDVDGNKVEKNVTQFSDRLFGIDQGSLSLSDTVGFKNYTNKQLNVSFLVPDSWEGQVGIGGAYTMAPIEKKVNNIIDITARTTTFDFLTDGKSPQNPSIEDYKKMKESFITEENIGKNLQVKIEKESFAGEEGYKIDYTYTLEADGRLYFKEEHFTVLGDTIYSLAFGGTEEEKAAREELFGIVKDSYKILAIQGE